MGVTERVSTRAAVARRAPSTKTRLVRRVCNELLSPFSSVTKWWLFTPFSANTKAASFYTTEWWLGGAIGRPLSGKIWNCKARGGAMMGGGLVIGINVFGLSKHFGSEVKVLLAAIHKVLFIFEQ
ncbi:hypothetical protein DEO72_LG6g700 [Vigna unguiculata]|uniref:Uncharacterized protein n=1 Tax=Vigna unguiculata TaxID=3917 RepID=A0A4D6M3T3_VIGUN|nr:hypothetical protein DEO72_LG6g700 [Vigna unguiculata]